MLWLHNRPLALTALLVCLTLSNGAMARQATYATPKDAFEALLAAVKSGNVDKIAAVLGPQGRALANSGDEVADQSAREGFIAAYDKKHEIEQKGDTTATLILGNVDFPFPIPLVASNGKWRFDTTAGADEILNRRIGENELAAIAVMHAYVDAQREYAEVDHDGKGVQYARRLLSSDNKKDGLYWPNAEGEAESPFGPLIANARAEGYSRHAGAPTPYHGYLFRMLNAQGKDAKDGERNFIEGGRMIGGFGLIAVPAKYGNSGIMTFIVNQDGTVYQRDLGPATIKAAAAVKSFNPDATWKAAQP